MYLLICQLSCVSHVSVMGHVAPITCNHWQSRADISRLVFLSCLLRARQPQQWKTSRQEVSYHISRSSTPIAHALMCQSIWQLRVHIANRQPFLLVAGYVANMSAQHAVRTTTTYVILAAPFLVRPVAVTSVRRRPWTRPRLKPLTSATTSMTP